MPDIQAPGPVKLIRSSRGRRMTVEAFERLTEPEKRRVLRNRKNQPEW